MHNLRTILSGYDFHLLFFEQHVPVLLERRQLVTILEEHIVHEDWIQHQVGLLLDFQQLLMQSVDHSAHIQSSPIVVTKLVGSSCEIPTWNNDEKVDD